LPSGVEAAALEVATSPSVGSDGSFVTENVKDFDILQPTQTTYVGSDRLDVGVYYVHVQTLDDACSYLENNTCFAWSPTATLTISPPPNRSPTLRWARWITGYYARAGMRVCDDTDGRLTFRTTLTHKRRGRTITQRATYRPYSSPTFNDGEIGCEEYSVAIPHLLEYGPHTMRMTVTDARGATSKQFVKRFYVGD
jgi:hypothetical protein